MTSGRKWDTLSVELQQLWGQRKVNRQRDNRETVERRADRRIRVIPLDRAAPVPKLERIVPLRDFSVVSASEFQERNEENEEQLEREGPLMGFLEWLERDEDA